MLQIQGSRPTGAGSRTAAWSRRGVAGLLVVVGLGLAAGGVMLAWYGGSPYYLLSGIAVVVSGILIWRRDGRGVLVYVAVLASTTTWAIWEVGFDGWQLLPRLLAPFVLGLALLPPSVRLGGRQSPATRVGGMAGLCGRVGPGAGRGRGPARGRPRRTGRAHPAPRRRGPRPRQAAAIAGPDHKRGLAGVRQRPRRDPLQPARRPDAGERRAIGEGLGGRDGARHARTGDRLGGDTDYGRPCPLPLRRPQSRPRPRRRDRARAPAPAWRSRTSPRRT